MHALRLLSLLALAGFATEVQGATPPQIGTTAVAQNNVTSSLGASQRTLKRGDGVFQNESIATGKNAGAQLLFRDETALTMGPESRVILDKLIYDPDKKTGEMTIRAVSGAFRFVTGSGPKAGYKIETPIGTIGVRGSIFQVWIRELGPSIQVILQVDEGGAFICGASKCVDVGVGMYAVQKSSSQPGNSQSKYGKECGAGGGPHCYVSDGGDTLLVDFLGRRTFDLIIPTAVQPPPPVNNPPPPPGNNPPPPPGNGPPPPVNNPPPPPVNNPPPPPQTGFSPIINPGVGTPPGLIQQLTAPGGSLPPGLQNRCGSGECLKPGPQTAPGRNK